MKMKYFGSVFLAMLLQSCASKPLQPEETERLNSSALYDPPVVTLIPGHEYQFAEGIITGTGQKFHSDFYYLRALTIGK